MTPIILAERACKMFRQRVAALFAAWYWRFRLGRYQDAGGSVYLSPLNLNAGRGPGVAPPHHHKKARIPATFQPE